MAMSDGQTERLVVAFERLAKAVEALAARPVATAAAPAVASGPVFGFGRSKGSPVATATAEDCEYYGGRCLASIADPAKAQYVERERKMLAAINARLKALGKPPIEEPVQEQEYPPPGAPSEADVPF